jgi:hypothetical protein
MINTLKKIKKISMKKILSSILVLCLFSFLFIPSKAEAGFLEFSSIMLDGVEEISAPFTGWLIKAFFVATTAKIALKFSSGFLEKTINLDINIIDNPFVEAGWNFVANITNMLIIVALVFIAISSILGIGNINVKKLLPKLLISALLVNFSLLLVGGFADIAQIAYNTIIDGNEGIVLRVIESLDRGLDNLVNGLAVFLATTVSAYMIPVSSAFSQLSVALIFIGSAAAAFQKVAIIVSVLVSAIVISIMFFTLGGLFLIRIFIIQLLAIVSPIAIISSVFSDANLLKKNYWKMWIGALIDWTILGIPLLLFIILGVKASQGMMHLGKDPIQMTLFYHLSLAIFLAVAYYISKSQSPMFAKEIINGAKAAGGFLWAKGLKPIGRAVGRSATDFAIDQEQRAASFKKQNIKGRGIHQAGNILAKGVKGLHYVALTTPEAAKKKRRDALIKKYSDLYEKNPEKMEMFAKNPLDLRKGPFTGMDSLMAIATVIKDKKGVEGLNLFKDNDLSRIYEQKMKEDPKKLFSLAQTSILRTIDPVEILKNEKKAHENKAKSAATETIRKTNENKAKNIGSIIKELEGKSFNETIDIVNSPINKGILGEDVLGNINNTSENIKNIKRYAIPEDDKDYTELLGLIAQDSDNPSENEKESAFLETIGKKTLLGIKPSEIEKVKKDVFKNEHLKKAIVRYSSSSVRNKILSMLGESYAKSLQDLAEELDLKKVGKTNRSIILDPYTSSGEIFFRKWKGIKDKEAAKEFLKTGAIDSSPNENSEKKPKIIIDSKFGGTPRFRKTYDENIKSSKKSESESRVEGLIREAEKLNESLSQNIDSSKEFSSNIKKDLNSFIKETRGEVEKIRKEKNKRWEKEAEEIKRNLSTKENKGKWEEFDMAAKKKYDQIDRENKKKWEEFDRLAKEKYDQIDKKLKEEDKKKK